MADISGVGNGTEVPQAVAHSAVVKVEYAVLLCGKPQYRRAQTVKGMKEHLRSFHHER